MKIQKIATRHSAVYSDTNYKFQSYSLHFQFKYIEFKKNHFHESNVTNKSSTSQNDDVK